jgi:hypothetical protein
VFYLYTQHELYSDLEGRDYTRKFVRSLHTQICWGASLCPNLWVWGHLTANEKYKRDWYKDQITRDTPKEQNVLCFLMCWTMDESGSDLLQIKF